MMAKEVKTREFGALKVLNNDDSNNKVYNLKPGSFAIGSSINAQIRLKNQEVQDVHCIVTVYDTGVATVTSQSNIHSTKLNNKVLRKDKHTLLNSDDIVLIGDVKIIYKNDSLTKQQLVQKSKAVVNPKMFPTPRRGSVTNSAHKPFSTSVSRLMYLQRRRPTSTSLNENLPNAWETVVVSPSGGSSSGIEVSKSGSTTPGLLTDSNDMKKPLARTPVNLFKSFEIAEPETPKTLADKLPDLLSTEGVLDLPISGTETPHFSRCESLLRGKPIRRARTKSFSDLTAPVFHSESDRRTLLCNKSFAAYSNKNTSTPKATTIFKTPTSVVRKSSTLKRKRATAFPVSVRSRSLSTASRQSASSTLDESVAEDLEEMVALSPNTQSRRSRQSNRQSSQVSVYGDIVVRRSRSLTPALRITSSPSIATRSKSRSTRQSENSSQNLKSFSDSITSTMSNGDETKEILFLSTLNGDELASNSVNRRSSLSLPRQFENDIQASSSANISRRRSQRSMLIPARLSESNTKLKRGLSLGNVGQKVVPKISSSPSIATRYKSLSTRQSGSSSQNFKSFSNSTTSTMLNKDESKEKILFDSTPNGDKLASNSVHRRSSLSLPRQFENDIQASSSANISRRKSQRSMLIPARLSESNTKLKRGLSLGNVGQKVVPKISSSPSIATRYKSLSTRQSGSSSQNFKSFSNSTTSTMLNKDESKEKILFDSTPNGDKLASNSVHRRSSLSLPRQFENDIQASSSANISRRKSQRSMLIPARLSESNTKLKRGLSLGNVGQKVVPKISSSPSIATRYKSLSTRQSGNSSQNFKSFSDSTTSTMLNEDESKEKILFDSTPNGDKLASNSVHRRSSLSLPRQFENDIQASSSANISSRKSPRSMLIPARLSESNTKVKRGLSLGNVGQNMLPRCSSSPCITRSKSLSTRLPGNSSQNFSGFSGSATSTVSNEDETKAIVVLDSTLDSEGNQTWETDSTASREDLSALDSPVGSSSLINTTGSSSFVYLNLPCPDPFNSVSGIEKLEETVQANNSRNSIKSSNAEKKNPLVPFSSKSVDINDDDNYDDVFENIDDNSEVIEQTLMVKTPRNDGSKQMVKTRKIQKSPKNDLSDVVGVRKIMATPKSTKSPKNDLRDVRGVKKIMKTPKLVKPPKNDLSDLPEFKQLFYFPKSPKNNLDDVRGVKKIMKTPKIVKSPENDLSNLPEFKQLFYLPKSSKNNLDDVRGVKKIMKTPKTVKAPKNDLRNVPEFKQLFEIPKSAKNNADITRRVKRLLSSSKQNSPKNDLRDVRGVSRIMKTPKIINSPKNDLSNIPEIKQLFEKQKSPKNDLRDVKGIRNMLKTPKTRRTKLEKSPKNDLRDPYGVKKLLATPKPMKSPKNDLSDVTGVDMLMKTPNVLKSPKYSSENVDSGVLSGIQTTKTDRNRKNILLSKRALERATNSDYTDVKGVKRMYAEAEAGLKNTANVSGVAELFNQSSIPSSSETFTALFNKKPLRTYQSKSPSPYKLNRLEISRKSLDTSDESPLSSDIANWVENVNQQLVTNALDSASRISPSKNMNRETAEVAKGKRSNRLAAKTPIPSISIESPVNRKLRTTRETPITSTPLTNDIVSESYDVKQITKGILKESVNKNMNSPVAGSRRTCRNKNVSDAAKENMTPNPDTSDTDSHVTKTVTFDVLVEDTRRSKRTPRKPAKFVGFISELSTKNETDKEVQEVSAKEVVKQIPRKHGKKIADKDTMQTSEEPAVNMNGQDDRLVENESQMIVKNNEDKKPAKRRRGKQLNENEKSPTTAETIEGEKPAKRLRGKRNPVNDDKAKTVEPETVEENDEKGKKLPTTKQGRKQKINEKIESENESEVNIENESEVNIKDLGEARTLRSRRRKPQVDEKINYTENEPKQVKRRVRPNADQSPNVSEVSTTTNPEQKPVTRRGRKRKDDEVSQTLMVTDSEEVATVQQRRQRNAPKEKIDQNGEEAKKPVKTVRPNADQSPNESEVSTTTNPEQKPATRRGRKRKDDEVSQTLMVTDSEEVATVQQRRQRNAPKEKIDQNGEEAKKPVKTRSRNQKLAKEQDRNDAERPEAEEKIVKARGRRAAVKKPIVNEDELNENCETVDDGPATVPLRRATRKRAGEEAVIDVQPVRKSARTRK